jgi:hypothetical protein
MERRSGGEWTARTTGASGFYECVAVVTPYLVGGTLGQGTYGSAVSAASNRGALRQATRRLNTRVCARVVFTSTPRGGRAWPGRQMEKGH